MARLRDTETWFALPGILLIGYFTDPQEMKKLQQHGAIHQQLKGCVLAQQPARSAACQPCQLIMKE